MHSDPARRDPHRQGSRQPRPGLQGPLRARSRSGLDFDESIDAINAIWTQERAEFHGTEIDFGPIWCWPKPVQRPRPPVLIAGHGPAALGRVLERGDGWLPSHRGRDPLAGEIRRLRSRAREMGRPSPSVTFLAASADVQAARGCQEAGVDRILLPVAAGPEGATERDLDLCELVKRRLRE